MNQEMFRLPVCVCEREGRDVVQHHSSSRRGRFLMCRRSSPQLKGVSNYCDLYFAVQ